MRQRMVRARGRLATVVVALLFALSSAIGETRAESAPEADSQPAAAPRSATQPAAETDRDATEDGALSSDELQTLVAPVALYPDLVLVLALQASLARFDIVQADRFLTQYAEDPSLLPDQGWDESLIGLLNYPTVVRTMSADLDWTDTPGQQLLLSSRVFRTRSRIYGPLCARSALSRERAGDHHRRRRHHPNRADRREHPAVRPPTPCSRPCTALRPLWRRPKPGPSRNPGWPRRS